MVAPIRVLLAESNPAIRHALQRLLRQVGEVQVIAVATDAAGALRQATLHQPEVVVLDVMLPADDERSVLHALRDACPTIPVVGVGIYPSLREQTLADGACRFVLLDASRAELVTAVQQAAQGDCQIGDTLSASVAPNVLPR